MVAGSFDDFFAFASKEGGTEKLIGYISAYVEQEAKQRRIESISREIYAEPEVGRTLEFVNTC